MSLPRKPKIYIIYLAVWLNLAIFATVSYAIDAQPNSDNLPINNSITDANENLKERYLSRLKIYPNDYLTRFELGKLYLTEKNTQAAKSTFLKLTSLQPKYYQAYHELVLLPLTKEELASLIDLLAQQKLTKPKDFTYYLALSELYEKDGQYYLAARALVDSSFANVVPSKYGHLLSSRINLLLLKAKNADTDQHIAPGDEDLDNLPPPIPESKLKRANLNKNLLEIPNQHVKSETAN